jgi:hypothetical protein
MASLLRRAARGPAAALLSTDDRRYGFAGGRFPGEREKLRDPSSIEREGKAFSSPPYPRRLPPALRVERGIVVEFSL